MTFKCIQHKQALHSQKYSPSPVADVSTSLLLVWCLIISPMGNNASGIFQFSITYGSSYRLSSNSANITITSFHCLVVKVLTAKKTCSAMSFPYTILSLSLSNDVIWNWHSIVSLSPCKWQLLDTSGKFPSSDVCLGRHYFLAASPFASSFI
jgi:hypothetical protein